MRGGKSGAVTARSNTSTAARHLNGWSAHCVCALAAVKQLDQYEEAVMQKRFEEMSDAERDALLEEIESEKTK